MLNQWKNFFTQGIIDEQEAPTYLMEAYTLLQNTNLSTEEREMADTMTRQEEIFYSQLAYARKAGMERGLAEGLEKGLAEGIEKGLAEGRAQGEQDGAMRTLTKNVRSLSKELSAEKIASLLALPLEQVKEILSKA